VTLKKPSCVIQLKRMIWCTFEKAFLQSGYDPVCLITSFLPTRVLPVADIQDTKTVNVKYIVI